MGDSVTDLCLKILNEDLDASCVNSTLITLIPKIDNPSSVSQYRPISLYSLIYKIVSKCLTIRMKPVMDFVISECQSAFVGVRQIFDNAIVGFECMHKLRGQTSGNSGYCCLKLDMSKAYDCVEWEFVRRMMLRMGFSSAWVRKFMNCISTASFAVLINDREGSKFTTSRGLRQGCPLSPFLFIICAKGFSALIQMLVQVGEIKGLQMSRDAPTVSHLFFADDSLLFAGADLFSTVNLRNVIKTYEAASGQAVNFQKSSICFSPNVDQALVEDIKNVFGIEVVERHAKYLGLPSSISRNKRDIFTPICMRVSGAVARWKDKMISTAGKEVLIKSVAQAIPNYMMSLFCLPKGIIKDTHGLYRDFW